jgi:glucokinase
MTILVADIGATNTRCALGTAEGVGTVSTFLNRDFPGPDALLGQYLRAHPGPGRPAAAALAVAAPIRGDAVEMLNISWRFSIAQLRRSLGLASLRVLNDFAALAWALPALGPQELTQIGRGEVTPRYPMAVLGPGTGLGVAALVPGEGTWRAIAGEGGHATLPACDDTEERVIGLARQRFGHCSAERILSGAGLTFLHAALHG